MPRRKIEAAEEQVGQPGIVTMPSDGEARLERPEIVPVDGPDWKAKAELLAFMEEPVTVVVHTSTDKNASQIVEVWNDGRVQRFLRGEEQVVKRKFVEVLARAKSDTFRSVEYMDEAGNQAFRYPKTTSLKYPFAVIRDDNPKGSAWLKKILAEA